MARCSHAQWLELDGLDPQWAIMNPGRLNSLVQALPEPAVQYPSIVLAIGRRTKTTTLQAVFARNNASRRDVHGIANLSVDGSSECSKFPIFIADSTPGATCANQIGSWTGCHEDIRYKLRGQNAIMRKDAVQLILQNLLRPQCHLVCIFADDMGGNQACEKYLQRWCFRSLAEKEKKTLRPALLILTSTTSEIQRLLNLDQIKSFDSSFSSCRVLEVDFKDESFANRDTIKLAIKTAVDQTRAERRNEHLLFNAQDTAVIFDNALSLFCQDPQADFDPFAAYNHPASREPEKRSVSGNVLFEHRPPLSLRVVTDQLASAFLMRAYPDGYHRFAPSLLKDRLLASKLEVVVSAAARHGRTEINAATIYDSFYSLAEELTDSKSANSVSSELLAANRCELSVVQSIVMCLSCLSSGPEHALPCGHSICDFCLKAFYQSAGNGYTFIIDRCRICGQSAQRTARIKPPTAQPNLLAVDGGGVRGILTLQLLQRLEEELRVPYRIWQFFDLVIGTSAGGLIVLDLLVCGSSLSASIYKFAELAGRVFHKSPRKCCWLCQEVCDLLSFLNSDRSELLESIVQETFGTTATLFDSATQTASNTKIAITATAVSDSRLRIFTNYNGAERTDANYAIIRFSRAQEEPKIWEVARCTTAAPLYFRPYHLKGFGKIDDGGLSANNPTETGLLELKVLWPSCPSPGVVVSAGTGYQKSPAHELVSSRGFWHDMGVPRIVRAWMSSPCLHGQNSWVALMNRLDPATRPKFKRLNVEFDQEEPALGDADQIPSLQALAQSVPLDLTDARDRIWAASFFFELVAAPSFRDGLYHCRGQLCSRFNDARPLFRAIHSLYPKPLMMIDGNICTRLSNDMNEACCSRCGTFRARIDFDVRRLEDNVAIQIAYTHNARQNISGCPAPLKWFSQVQREWLDAKDDHWTWKNAKVCSCASDKRKGSTYSGGRRKKARTY